jgi:glycerol uptake facilitator-like aquaporin
MSDGARIGFSLVLELIGSIMLGMGQSIFRQSTLMLIFFPLWCWFCYASCYRVSGGHLNPIFSIASLLRPDKPEGQNNMAVILYIPIQFFGFTLGVLCQWWFDQYAAQIRYKLKPGETDKYYFSECTWMEIFASFIIVMVFLTQSGYNSTCSKDQSFQSFAIGISYGAYVIYSYYWPGGCLNPAYAFAQALWNIVDTKKSDEEEAFKFFGLYVACSLIGMGIAVAVHWIVSVKAHDQSKAEDLEHVKN